MPVLYMTDEEYARYVNIKKEIGAIKTRLYGVRARRLDEQLRLVYVEESYYLEGFHTCYFTAMDIQDATGDDWDDAPYEHNAGEPNQFDKVYFIQGVTTPNNEYLNSPYTVEGINRGGSSLVNG